MMWRALGSLIAGALAGAAVLYVFQTGNYQRLTENLNEHVESRHQLEAEVGRVNSALSQLKSEMQILRAELQHTRPTSIEPNPTGTWSKGTEDSSRTEELSDFDEATDPFETAEEKSAKERELENQARLERNDAIHYQETVDPQWAKETTQKITEAFLRAELSASQISEVDCRTTRCRVILIHADNAAHRVFQHTLSTPSGLGSILPRAAFSYFDLEDGSVETVMFLYQKSLRSGS